MFSLVKYVKKELKKNQLNEAFDYFNALSNEVKRRITRSYDMKGKVGKASKVEILPYNPEDIYDKLVNNKIVAAVLRYGQDDMLLFIDKGYSGVDPERLDDLKELDIFDDNYRDRFQLPNYIKSESGFKKICNNLCLLVVKMKSLKKKDVLLKMNFQIIHYDQSKQNIHMDRSIARSKYNPTITRNGVTTPSNQMYDDKNNNHTKLMQRLKAFIENKIPNILDINDLPKDLNKLTNENFQFKLMGDTYKYNDSENVNGVELLNGEPFGLIFECTNDYRKPNNPLLPQKIIFNVAYKNGQFNVVDILCTDNYWYRGRNDSDTYRLADYIAQQEQKSQSKNQEEE